MKKEYILSRSAVVSAVTLERLVAWSCCLFVFLIPLPHATTVKESAYYLATGLGCYLVVRRPGLWLGFGLPLFWPLLIFGFWILIGAFFSLDVANSLHDVYAYWFRYIVYYLLLVHFFRSDDRIECLGRTVLLSALVIDGYLLWNHAAIANYDSVALFSHKLETGLPEMPVNWVGIMTCFALAVGLRYIFHDRRSWLRWLGWIATGIFSLVVFLTQSRATLIAFSLVLLYMAWSWRRLLILLLCPLLVVFVALSPVSQRIGLKQIELDPRISTSLLTLNIMKDYPLWGIGYGCQIHNERIDIAAYRSQLPQQYQNNCVEDPHNLFLSIALRCGIVGIILFLGVLVAFARNLFILRQRAGDRGAPWNQVITAAFGALVTIGFFEPTTNHLFFSVFFTILGMGSALLLTLERSCRQ